MSPAGNMTVASDLTPRGQPHGHIALEDRFEVLKEIGDGSFGSVVLARVRTAGANVARRGSVVSSPYSCAFSMLRPLDVFVTSQTTGRYQVYEEDV